MLAFELYNWNICYYHLRGNLVIDVNLTDDPGMQNNKTGPQNVAMSFRRDYKMLIENPVVPLKHVSAISFKNKLQENIEPNLSHPLKNQKQQELKRIQHLQTSINHCIMESDEHYMHSAYKNLDQVNNCIKFVDICLLTDSLVLPFGNKTWVFSQFFSSETSQLQFRKKIIDMINLKHYNNLNIVENMLRLIHCEIDLLTAACQANDIELVISLMQKYNCNINESDALGWTLLWVAVKFGNCNIVQWLIS